MFSQGVTINELSSWETYKVSIRWQTPLHNTTSKTRRRAKHNRRICFLERRTSGREKESSRKTLIPGKIRVASHQTTSNIISGQGSAQLSHALHYLIIDCTLPTLPSVSRTLIPWGWVELLVRISLTMPSVNLPLRWSCFKTIFTRIPCLIWLLCWLGSISVIHASRLIVHSHNRFKKWWWIPERFIL